MNKIIDRCVKEKAYKNKKTPATILRDFKLEVSSGETIAIVGKSGVGKTSLLNIICGSIEVDRGTVFINDTEITNQKDYLRHRKIGRVYQDPSKGTCPNMTILENLSLAEHKGKAYGLLKGVNKNEAF